MKMEFGRGGRVGGGRWQASRGRQRRRDSQMGGTQGREGKEEKRRLRRKEQRGRRRLHSASILTTIHECFTPRVLCLKPPAPTDPASISRCVLRLLRVSEIRTARRDRASSEAGERAHAGRLNNRPDVSPPAARLICYAAADAALWSEDNHVINGVKKPLWL